MKQNSEKKNFLHKADRQNMPVCFITGKIYRKQEYEIKTETDYKINYIDDFKHIKFGICLIFVLSYLYNRRRKYAKKCAR